MLSVLLCTRILKTYILFQVLTSFVQGELGLPCSLLSLTSHEGQKAFIRAKYKGDAFSMLENFVAQVNDAYCGPASAVTVLNSLGVGLPMQDPASGLDLPEFAYYTQDNVFSLETERVKPKAQIREEGLSLSELSTFIAAHSGVNATYRHSRDMRDMNEFRQLAVSALAQPNVYVIANFFRQTLQERGQGHHSPIAAYNEEIDSFLVLDVSRYKYPSWWVPVSELFAAVLPRDPSDVEDPGRGLVFVWAQTSNGTLQPSLGREFFSSGLDDGMPTYDFCDDVHSAFGLEVLSFLAGIGILCLPLLLFMSTGVIKVSYQAPSWGIVGIRNFWARDLRCSIKVQGHKQIATEFHQDQQRRAGADYELSATSFDDTELSPLCAVR
ncbi:hypothetical protein CEUSTIGMA_g5416.t1 [Chlamydomonas eustigma]|uniref:glutathione gamma-glutamylcysteinyltransferase n=1 Tax=Chlamydomonas eustigma TaxID=1157962 RepID=A0A250X4G5_9CHLO|nr:hypothetical protein CEUSTIGMA_g5416.t1 [Chlamydomonas eustigma]|eukprot:GAX77974.1 hypothetical protein CEUSTIGMA_g5416.t1 [Chlamydomonas eustigma]